LGKRIIGNSWKLIFKEIEMVFPLAVSADPEKMGQFSTAIATLVGDIEDPRPRGEILYAGWRAIIPPKIAGTDKEDLAAFFRLRDEYLAFLPSTKDRELLREEIDSRMTPLEAMFQRDLDLMRPYFAIWDEEFARPKNRNALRNRDLLAHAHLTAQVRLIERLEDDDDLNGVLAEITRRRLEKRDDDTMLDATLRFWGYNSTTRPDSPKAERQWITKVNAWRAR
jgi:hypothetical protein